MKDVYSCLKFPTVFHMTESQNVFFSPSKASVYDISLSVAVFNIVWLGANECVIAKKHSYPTGNSLVFILFIFLYSDSLAQILFRSLPVSALHISLFFPKVVSSYDVGLADHIGFVPVGHFLVCSTSYNIINSMNDLSSTLETQWELSKW